jgi:hypothetical protein
LEILAAKAGEIGTQPLLSVCQDVPKVEISPLRALDFAF